MGDFYAELGVSATKEDVHSAIQSHDAGIFPGAFCMVIPDILSGDPDYCNVFHADGAGTKSNVAYLDYVERGDPSVFRGIAQDSAVMNTDDVLCVGAVDNLALSNTVGRNPRRFGREPLTHLLGGYADFCQAVMRASGVSIELVGGETADIGDIVSTVAVDSSLAVRLRRSDIIDCSGIRPGNVIIGLASYGRSVYENAENSGIGSNGLTAARHVMLSHHYARYPETYASDQDPDKAYAGPYRLADDLPGADMTVGQALLSPTRTYLPFARALLEVHRDAVTGIIHNTGGGQRKSGNFGDGLHYVKDNPLPAPAIFHAIQAAGEMRDHEMFGVFNMGTRLEVYADPDAADDIVALSQSFNIDAQIVGRVEASPDEDNHVSINVAGGLLKY